MNSHLIIQNSQLAYTYTASYSCRTVFGYKIPIYRTHHTIGTGTTASYSYTVCSTIMATYLIQQRTIVARSTGTVFLNIPTSTQLYSTGMRSIIRRIIAAVNSAPEHGR